MKPEIIFRPQFSVTRFDLPPAAETFGFLALVEVHSTAGTYRSKVEMTKETPLDEIITNLAEEAHDKGGTLRKVIFLEAEEKPVKQ